jgi:hypothetical protein
MTVPDDRIHDGGFPSGPVTAEGEQSRCILTINGGSSSLKFAVFVAANSIERLRSWTRATGPEHGRRDLGGPGDGA